ncbi:MAG: ABC transporter ATP-binding protein/permease [Gammaproteobacteria bacterium]|nr:ABC transporter ATP-binding protein/permease [Gammaproteobacteria bacterium]
MAVRSNIRDDKKGNLTTVKRLLPYLWDYRGRVGAGLALLVLARSANVSVPIVLKFIVDALEGVSAGASSVSDSVSGFASDSAGVAVGVALALVVGYGALRFASVLFNELRNVVFSRASVQIIHRISTEVLRHLHDLSLGFHLDRKSGALSRGLERGTGAVSGFLRMFVFNIIPVAFELVAVVTVLLVQFEIQFAAITVGVIILYSIFTVKMTQWRVQFRVQMNRAESEAHGLALDSLLNYETVKLFGNENMEATRYGDSLDGWVRASLKSNSTLAWLNIGQAAIVAGGLTALLWLAARGVASGALTLGDFVMINAFLIQLYIPLNFMGSIYRDINHSLVDMHDMFELLDIKPEVVESPNAKALRVDNGAIRFDKVSFAYKIGDADANDNTVRMALRDIDFQVPGGRMVAVVGPSGAGKSTLSRLLLRFYDPAAGRILIDGQDLRAVTLSSLRAAMGVVPQDTVLFNASIGYNIKYGRPPAAREDIAAAARIARLDEFIAQHPKGYGVKVGERGLKLSGGEKQRVAIARAALKGAPILIFDEATSSLDSRAEKAIQLALERVAQNSTTVVIAHRLSTIVGADEIIVLDQGRIVEQGAHDALLARDGLYAQMWKLQKEAADHPDVADAADSTNANQDAGAVDAAAAHRAE